MTESKKDAPNTGRVVEVKGVVIDVAFGDQLPAIYNALEIEIAPLEKGGKSTTLTAEVQQHLGDDRVRAVAMQSTDGLARGVVALDTGSSISVPVGQETLGRLWNVLGQAIDEREAPPADMER